MTRKDFLAGVLKASASTVLSGMVAPLANTAGQPSASSLKAIGEHCGVLVGCQAERVPLQSPDFASMVKTNFNLLTPGNELKWTRIRPKPDSYNFADGDWMVQFAKSNGMRVHGHNLCWNSPANPPWFQSVLTKENARHYLEEHITTVMKHYVGQIDSWDVVNEPVVSWSRRPDGFYPGIWLNLLGTQYIDIAFQAAAAADPRALRVLNCYQLEQDTPDNEQTRSHVLTLLKQLISRRVPIQAIGIESHLDASIPLGGPKFARFLTEVNQMGLKVLITELDINDTKVAGDIQTRDAAVAKTYHDYISEVNAVTNLNALIFWTVSDRFNWLNSPNMKQFQRSDGQKHRSGLVDESLNAKSSYTAVGEALQSKCR